MALKNEDLAKDDDLKSIFLDQVNASPYGDGWIIKVKMSIAGELNSLMDSEQYTKFCEEEDAKH